MSNERQNMLGDPEHRHGAQAIHVQGVRVAKGDKVKIDRDGWRDKVGRYVGKDKSNRVRVRFEEHGGAVLLCQARELRLVQEQIVSD